MADYDSRTIARFWAKVDVRGPGECWPWTSFKNPCGYGYFSLSRTRGTRRRLRRSHRVAWELAYGQIPKGEGYHGTCVLHRCDNRVCCNVAHLFIGTQADNMRDMDAKGRRAPMPYNRGEKHGRAKLTEADVMAIRGSDETAAAIARRLGVSDMAVHYARKRRNWAHVT